MRTPIAPRHTNLRCPVGQAVLSAALVAFSLLSSQTLHAQHHSVVTGSGAGATTCEALFHANGRRQLEIMDMQWAIGFLHGLADAEPNNKRLWDNLRTTSPGKLRSSLEAFCNQYPARTLLDAVVSSYVEFGGTRK